MNKVNSIHDVADLLYEMEVTLRYEGNEVFVEFPDSDNFPGSQPNPHEKPLIPGDPIDLNFGRQVRNTIRSLVSAQFRRVTATASHLTQFGWVDAGKLLGIVSCRKKGGEPFTIIFKTNKQAKSFCSTVEKNRLSPSH